MVWEKAFRRAVKSYFDNVNPTQLNSLKKPKYTKRYFDKVGSDYGVDPVDPATCDVPEKVPLQLHLQGQLPANQVHDASDQIWDFVGEVAADD